MINSNEKPILITGSHRSGSTWVGNMVSLSPSVVYVHEPFNLDRALGICRAKFDCWFQYICYDNESLYLNDIEDCLNFKYKFSEEFKSARSLKDIAKLSRDYMRFVGCKALKKKPLIKDPIAVFSAEWLAKRFNMDVLILIRHPAAFAGSLKKAGWTHPFSHFLEQPLLIERHLSKYRSEIEEYSKTEKDIVDQAILLWNLVHHMILDYRESHPDWIFMKHEDLSRDPLEEFRNIYNRLGLDFSMSIQQEIETFSSGDSNKEELGSLKRDSLSNISSWKKRLTCDEIRRIKESTQELAKEFYTEEDWLV